MALLGSRLRQKMGVLLGKVGLEHGVAETSWSFERYIPRAGTTAENFKKNIRPFHAREKITIQDGGLFQGEAGTSTYFTPRKGESSNEGFPKKKKVRDLQRQFMEGKGKHSYF